MNTLIQTGKNQGKKLVVTGCVPQGDKRARELQDLSLLGAQVLAVDILLLLGAATLRGAILSLKV